MFTFYLGKTLYAEGTFTVQPVVYQLTFMHFTFILFCILASEKKVINKLNQIPDWTYRALYWNTVPNLYTTLVIAFKLFVWYENKMHQKRCFLTSFKNCCLLAKNGNSQSTNYFFMRCRSKQSNNCNKIHAEFFCFLLSFDDIEWQVWIQFFFYFSKNVMKTERCEKVFSLHSSVKVKVYCNFSWPFLFERFTEWMTSIRKIRMNGFLKVNFSFFSAKVILWTILGEK
jgi:hypothetical protein